MKVKLNIARLKYLLKMYKLSIEDFLFLISEGLNTPLHYEEIFSGEIKLSHLKRIDKIFEKGLHYYLDPKPPETSKEASVFFRKESFGTNLNIRAKRVVNKFEELKISLSAIAKLAELKITRNIPKFKITDPPKQVAKEIRAILYPQFNNNRRNFLKSLITKFAEHNILVFEFVEASQRKIKANIDGFFLKPNVIVLKRHQTFTREIFTLAHELGHFLLDKEEIDLLEYQVIADKHLSKIERWCNDFAYYFLIGEYEKRIEQLEIADFTNDYNHSIIKTISKNTHLSKIALFTRLLLEKKISPYNYKLVKEDFEEQYKINKEEKERKKQLLKEQGIKLRGSTAKPISSPLFISTIQTAFYEGILNEYDVCKKLNIKPDKLDQYIQ